MHIAHLDRFRSVGRCAIFGFAFLGQTKSQDAYRTSRPIMGRLVDVRYSVLHFLTRQNHKMHIAHLDRLWVGWSMCDTMGNKNGRAILAQVCQKGDE